MEMYNVATEEAYSFMYVALTAKKKEDMFFVRCDKKTMLNSYDKNSFDTILDRTLSNHLQIKQGLQSKMLSCQGPRRSIRQDAKRRRGRCHVIPNFDVVVPQVGHKHCNIRCLTGARGTQYETHQQSN